MLDDDKKAELIRLITEKISSKGKSPHCPMCGNNSFSLVDGYFNKSMKSFFMNSTSGPKNLPNSKMLVQAILVFSNSQYRASR